MFVFQIYVSSTKGLKSKLHFHFESTFFKTIFYKYAKPIVIFMVLLEKVVSE
jgi:hypothetical protein